MDRVAVTVADLVSRSQNITQASLDDTFEAARTLAQPYDLTSGTVIISSILRETDNAPFIVWQRQGGGNLNQTSQIGQESQNAQLPNSFTLNEDENVISVEVFYEFEPWLFDVFVSPHTFSRQAFFRPRLAHLTVIN